MPDSRPSTADEKSTVVEPKSKRGFFSRKPNDKASSDPEKHGEPAPEAKVEEVPPVGFFQLFRCVPLNESTAFIPYANLSRLVILPSSKLRSIL